MIKIGSYANLASTYRKQLVYLLTFTFIFYFYLQYIRSLRELYRILNYKLVYSRCCVRVFDQLNSLFKYTGLQTMGRFSQCLSSLPLNASTDEAVIMSSGRLFHKLTTLLLIWFPLGWSVSLSILL